MPQALPQEGQAQCRRPAQRQAEAPGGKRPPVARLEDMVKNVFKTEVRGHPCPALPCPALPPLLYATAGGLVGAS